jgi:hypothetical protein
MSAVDTDRVRFVLFDTAGDSKQIEADTLPWQWRHFLVWRNEDRLVYTPLDNVDRFEVIK